MENIIIPIQIQSNSISKELITVGLIAGSAEKSFCEYSEEKLKIANKLLAYNDNSLESFLKQIKHKVSQINKQGTLLNETDNFFSVGFLKSLENYNNGLIQLNNSLPFASAINKEKFSQIFEKFTGAKLSESKAAKPSLHKKITKTISKYKGIKNKIDVNFTLKAADSKELFFDTKVEVITVNGAIQAFQSLDFNQTEETLKKHIYENVQINKGLLELGKAKKNKVDKLNIVFEPAANSKTFNQLYKQTKSVFNYQELNEFDSKMSGINESDQYKKFSELIG